MAHMQHMPKGRWHFLSDTEILTRAREAAIKHTQPHVEAVRDDIRYGAWDDSGAVAIAVIALQDIAKPLDQVVPSDPPVRSAANIGPGPQWDAESDRIEAEIAADREEPLSPEHVSALKRAETAEQRLDHVAEQFGNVVEERDRLLAEIHRITAQRDFLLEHIRRLVDRLAGAKMLAGDSGIEAATAFVNAERQGVNQVLERIGAE
jgi:hypothetical protein